MSPAPANNRRVAVAVSGSGRSLANLLAHSANGREYDIAAVIASRPDCKGAEIARGAGLPFVVEQFTLQALPELSERLYRWLHSLDISWVALAGFLKLFPIAPSWAERIINIHPALLPDFGGPGMYGDRVHAAVIASGRHESGATVHFANDHYDDGGIIAQIKVPVLAGDTTQDLAARVFAAECKLYPPVLSRLINGDLPRRDGGIAILE